jgi:signal transduction histidine kinase
MGVSSSAGPERLDAARRSIRFSFVARVAVPTGCLVLLWGLAVSATLAGHGLSSLNHRELASLILLAGGGLIVALAAVILMGSFARRLSKDISGLAVTARHLADQQLPQFVERLRDGEQVAEADEDSQRPHIKTAEIAEAVAAVASLQHTAVTAAAGEAKLRNGLRQVFVSLARRNQSLLQRQLRLIDALEQKASDPAALADLFSLDHLTTRMRRHAESLTILSGAAPGRSWSEPVPVIDVIRGATAEVEDYKRVTVLTRAEDAVVGSAVADMIHLLAELIENATLFSPSDTRVEIRAERVANGFAIEIDDRGLGIEFDELNEINQQLTNPPDFDLANADRLGLFVGGKLAARHGVRVSLRPSPYGGITAIVLMPSSIVVPIAQTGAGPRPDARLATGRPAGLDLRAAEAPALTGHRSPQPALSSASQPGTAPDNFSRASQPGTAPDSVSRTGQKTADTYRGLPRRTRQASLSPHLRDSPSPAAHSPGADAIPAPSDAYTPEHARDFAASLQSGWQRGRQADTPDASPAAAPPKAGRQDSDVPRGEEP